MNPIPAKHVQTFQQKVIGLIGKKVPQTLYFETRWGIHTFGVNFPIDVVVLDANNVIQKTKHNLRPNRIFLWNPKYYKVLEMPKGTIDKKKLEIGLQIYMKF